MTVEEAYKLSPEWKTTEACNRPRVKHSTWDKPLKGGAPNYKAVNGKLRPSRRPKGL